MSQYTIKAKTPYGMFLPSFISHFAFKKGSPLPFLNAISEFIRTHIFVVLIKIAKILLISETRF